MIRTADELIARIRASKPALRLAKSPSEAVVATWDAAGNRWRTVAGAMLGGGWAEMPEMMLNGKPVVEQNEWIEV